MRVVKFSKKPKTYSSDRDKAPVHFGKLDLSNLQLNPCNLCDKSPILKTSDKGFRVECAECGSHVQEWSKKPWQAIFNWNKSRFSKMPHYNSFTEFSLEDFSSASEARKYLKVVRAILEQRLKEARERRRLPGRKPPGRGYVEKLKAYLQLCIYAQGVCKHWDKIERKTRKISRT